MEHDRSLGSAYIRRHEEDFINEQIDMVRTHGTSRAVLLYGPGGVGKTRLIRTMANAAAGAGTDVRWVRPIDVDDSEYWLLANLERDIAESLDPERRHFGPYFEHMTRFSPEKRRSVSIEAVLGHLGRIQSSFVECYSSFIEATENVVVISLDTVEAIRSMYLLFTVTQWMKSLPHTVFILAGRPPAEHHRDPIGEHLGDPHHSLPTAALTMRGFERAEARQYLDSGPLGDALSDDEKDVIFDLTEGHPLWLAMTVEFLQRADPPPEMTDDADPLPFRQEGFRRRLVTPYRGTGFWPEAIKRLAVVRHSVNEQVWQRIMADHTLPDELNGDWHEAWQELLRTPWIRPRANSRYVTLHDALAEELAQRLIPLHDQDERWRQSLWRDATTIYTELAEQHEARLAEQFATTRPSRDEPLRDPEFVNAVARLDAEKRELDLLRTAQLHYRLLSDFVEGTQLFEDLYHQAADDQDVLFQELVCHELERFLPHTESQQPLEDVLGSVTRRFQHWLVHEEPGRYLEIGLLVARFLIHNDQPAPALDLLAILPDDAATSFELRYRLANELGNACLRIPGEIRRAKDHFETALSETAGANVPDQPRRHAQALKELGFYYRNLGQWEEADRTYGRARAAMSDILGPGSSAEDREEMASIQTNWAYLKALYGSYEEARNLVESAIAIRERIDNRAGIGLSLSVSGEVHRYDRKFQAAWDAYARAETVFQGLKNIPRLGLIYQEQAICLHQASDEDIVLVDDQTGRAQLLIKQALDVCRELAVRSYPSALNRAGRIFSREDADTGLRYFEESIDVAGRMGDGWFLSATLIEFLELSYTAWRHTGDEDYRHRLDSRVPSVEKAIRDYTFADLPARWDLLQGHLIVHDVLERRGAGELDTAITHYSRGFQRLTDKRIGSHGSVAIAKEFRRFIDIYETLPERIRHNWYRRLKSDWSQLKPERHATSLLARLEELY